MTVSSATEEAVLPAIVALLVAAIVGDVLILSFGQNPGTVYRLLLEGTWGNAYGLGQVLYPDKIVLAVAGADYLVELGLYRGAVPILGVLDEEHHQERDDRRSRVDDELPRLRELEDRSRKRPRQHRSDA